MEPGMRAHLSVPVHSDQPLRAGTLRALLTQSGLTEDDL
jgi:predicted RNA binding protein YcfA (HicA-like mRNA interferase family)